MMKRLLTITTAMLLAGALGACDSKETEKKEDTPEATQEKTETAEKAEKPEEVKEESERAADFLAMNYKGDAERVHDVILYRFADKPTQLGFYNEDVDCASIKETPEGDDRIVATAELDSNESIEDPGAIEIKKWIYNFESVDGDASEEATVTVTKAEPTTLEGTVKLTGTIADEAIEMNGPFVATVCDFEKG